MHIVQKKRLSNFKLIQMTQIPLYASDERLQEEMALSSSWKVGLSLPTRKSLKR